MDRNFILEYGRPLIVLTVMSMQRACFAESLVQGVLCAVCKGRVESLGHGIVPVTRLGVRGTLNAQRRYKASIATPLMAWPHFLSSRAASDLDTE
jgi:hypothetical protein